MKKTFIAFVLVVLSINVIAQEYSQSYKNGDTTIYYMNSEKEVIDNNLVATYIRKTVKVTDNQFLVEEFYTNGKLHQHFISNQHDPAFLIHDFFGEHYVLDVHGDTSLSEFYTELGRLDGYKYSVAKDGSHSYFEYDNGEQISCSEYNFNGQLVKEVVKNDDGTTTKRYNLDGSLAVVISDQDGDYYTKSESGIILKKESIKDNKYHGEVIEYYPNGKIKERKYYNSGLSNGSWLYYDTNGNVVKQEQYIANTGVLDYYTIYQDRKPIYKYTEGRMGGEIQFSVFDTNEVLRYERKTSNNITTVNYFDKNGKVLTELQIQVSPQLLSKVEKDLRKLDYDKDKRVSRGETTIEFELDKAGVVKNSRVIDSGNDYADSILLSYVQTLQFNGGRYFGESCEFGNAIKFTFTNDGFIRYKLGKFYPLGVSLFGIDGIGDNQNQALELNPFPNGGLMKLNQDFNIDFDLFQEAIDFKMGGTGVIGFQVHKSGIRYHFRVVKPDHPILDIAFVKNAKKMKYQWYPGVESGELADKEYVYITGVSFK